MDFIILKDFLVSYSLPTVLIATSVATVCVILGAIFKDKMSRALKGYLPFILSIVSYVIYDMISIEKVIFREDAFYAGILCGSLSALISSTANKIGRGELDSGSTVFLIKGLLKNYVSEDKLYQTALSLDNLLAQNKDDENGLLENIIYVLKDSASSTFTDEEFIKVAYLIIQTVKTIKH